MALLLNNATEFPIKRSWKAMRVSRTVLFFRMVLCRLASFLVHPPTAINSRRWSPNPDRDASAKRRRGRREDKSGTHTSMFLLSSHHMTVYILVSEAQRSQVLNHCNFSSQERDVFKDGCSKLVSLRGPCDQGTYATAEPKLRERQELNCYISLNLVIRVQWETLSSTILINPFTPQDVIHITIFLWWKAPQVVFHVIIKTFPKTFSTNLRWCRCWHYLVRVILGDGNVDASYPCGTPTACSFNNTPFPPTLCLLLL